MLLKEWSEQDSIKRLTAILLSDSPSRIAETDTLRTSREDRQPSSGSGRVRAPLMRGGRLGPGHARAGVTPPEGKLETLEQVFRGLAWAADELSAPFSGGDWSKLAFVGGDLATTRGPIYLDICVIGQRPSTWAPGGRAGAHPGETVYLSGPTGMAAGGFWLLKNQKTTFSGSEKLRKAFLWPEVELELGVRLWRDTRLTTCAHTSDSLSEQLRLLAEASDVGGQGSEDRLLLPPTLVPVADALGC